MPLAVLFDLYNTLVPAGDAERIALRRRQATDLGADPAEFARLFPATWKERCTGKLGDLPATLATLAQRAGGSPSESALALAVSRSEALTRRQLWPRPATLAALDTIRAAGWRTGLVTNCAGVTAPLWPTTPLVSRFDAVAMSSELGVAKPEPAIFLTACAQLGVTPTECLYVGDGADDELAAAAGLGMSVVRSCEYVESRATWPSRRIAALADLPVLLGSHERGRLVPPA